MLLCHIRLEKEKEREIKQERFSLAGLSLFIYCLLLTFVPAQKDHVRVHWKEDDCNVQRAVYVRELNGRRSSLWILSVPGFWIVGVFFKLRKSPVFTLG